MIRPYPPVVFGAGLLGALLGHLAAPLPLPGQGWARPAGLVLLLLAAALAVWAERTLHVASTPVLPFKDARLLVRSGPFRFSRNPIYLAFAVMTLAAAGLAGSWWPLLPLPVVLVVITRYVISGEERSLHRLFGVEYEAYRRRVRRWL